MVIFDYMLSCAPLSCCYVKYEQNLLVSVPSGFLGNWLIGISKKLVERVSVLFGLVPSSKALEHGCVLKGRTVSEAQSVLVKWIQSKEPQSENVRIVQKKQ